MKIACNGRRLEAWHASELLVAAGGETIADMMAAQGFRLKPMRAPRRLRHGNLVLRFAWEKRDDNVKVVIRAVITLAAPDVG